MNYKLATVSKIGEMLSDEEFFSAGDAIKAIRANVQVLKDSGWFVEQVSDAGYLVSLTKKEHAFKYFVKVMA